MRFIQGISKDVYFNFAAEEYFINNYEEPVFMLWENEECVMIGKNQNTLSEINYRYCREQGVQVVRRLTGGGTVYSSLGNMQYTIIQKVDQSQMDMGFREMTQSLIAYLKELGIHAEFSGRNDIVIDKRKISGNAQAHFDNIILHHGTILFDADLSKMMLALTPDPAKYQAKGIVSVKSRVTRIKDHLRIPMSVKGFFDGYFEFGLEFFKNAYEKPLTFLECESIHRISEEKWRTWEWNFGQSPPFQRIKKEKFEGGLVEVRMNIQKGHIEAIQIFGDFFGERDICELEKHLTGSKLDWNVIDSTLKDIHLDKYMHHIKNEELLKLML